VHITGFSERKHFTAKHPTLNGARATKAGGMDLISGRVTPKTWKTILATCTASGSALMGGASKRFTGGSAIVLPLMQHPLRK